MKFCTIAAVLFSLFTLNCAVKNGNSTSGDSKIHDSEDIVSESFDQKDSSSQASAKIDSDRKTRKTDNYTFEVKSKGLSVAVGTEMFFHRSASNLIPLQVKIHNRSRRDAVPISIENFHLVTLDGRVHEAVGTDNVKDFPSFKFEKAVESDTIFKKTVFSKKKYINWPDYYADGNNQENINIPPGVVLNCFLYFDLKDCNEKEYFEFVLETETELFKTQISMN